MQKSKRQNYQEIISIEEYLNKRQRIKEQKEKREAKEEYSELLLFSL